jgi:hypothetical protein
MGRYRNHRSRSTKIKKYSKAVRTRCRPMDMDQVQDNLLKKAELAAAAGGEENLPKPELDEDLPGLGQFHCITCARYFIDQFHLDTHLATKTHGKRVKQSKEQQYSQSEADFGAGKSKEILPPAHPNLRNTTADSMDQ